ncbi:hypothetical protein LTR29_005789 [Friedmanniomyces endolithicus]|nr:hypothetical protein LTR29_005789 [Friedmanniomyces endolithicus]
MCEDPPNEILGGTMREQGAPHTSAMKILQLIAKNSSTHRTLVQELDHLQASSSTTVLLYYRTMAGTPVETQAASEKLERLHGSTKLAGKPSKTNEVTIIYGPKWPGDQDTLCASCPVENKHLKGTVEVHFHDIVTDDAFPWCHTVYIAIFYQAAGAPQNDSVGIGQIELDIIDTSVPACEGEETWKEYLLEQSADYDDSLRPVSVAPKCLLDRGGGVREEGRRSGNVLGSRTFVYVCELELAMEWRKKGLGSVAMGVMHRMLPVHLGHSNAAMLLQPAILNRGVSKDLAGEYQEMLFRFYGSLGYENWFAKKNGAQTPYTLMGRKL